MDHIKNIYHIKYLDFFARVGVSLNYFFIYFPKQLKEILLVYIITICVLLRLSRLLLLLLLK
jgi:hypothetical protein